MLLNPEPTFEAIESAGGRVTKHAEAHVLVGFFFVSGEIERVTSYEARGSSGTTEIVTKLSSGDAR